jgi:hypothetical protein
MGLIRRFYRWFRMRDEDPEQLAAARDARYQHETIKTGAYDAPGMVQGQKPPRY